MDEYEEVTPAEVDSEEVPQKVTGHVYGATEIVFEGPETEDTYRYRNGLLVKALRSGQFTQSKQVLQRLSWGNGTDMPPVIEGQCCLGVGCLVAQTNGALIAAMNVSGNSSTKWMMPTPHHVGYSVWENETAPPIVREWFGWNDGNPILYDEAEEDGYAYNRAAAARNDSGKQGFAEIADAFERTFVTFTRKEPEPLREDPRDYLD